MVVHDVDKHCKFKQYIHDGDWVILTKSEKALMYMPLQVSTHWNHYNIIHVMLAWDNKWESYFTDNEFKTKEILLNYYKVDDERHISISETTYKHYKGPFGLVITDFKKTTFKATTKLEYNIFCV